jgi:hypothetical protein
MTVVMDARELFKACGSPQTLLLLFVSYVTQIVKICKEIDLWFRRKKTTRWRWFPLFSSSSRTKKKSSPILGIVGKSLFEKIYFTFLKFICEIDAKVLFQFKWDIL